MRYPIGIQTFQEIIEDGYVYVDKTAFVHQLVTTGKIYFLCRPRRFGKSLLLSTLKAYFQGKKELFKGLAMEKLETEWAEYPVFHVDFNGQNFNNPDELSDKIESFIAKAEVEYGKEPLARTFGDRFAAVLANAHAKTGRRCVVLIDEYDKPLLDVLDTNMEEKNRETLKAFYSTFKAADEHLRFVMLTGVTKFSQITVFSGLNQPKDISMSRHYDTICGISEEELHSYFNEPVADMARRYGVPVPEMYELLKRQYDGYHFSENMLNVYNPYSLLNALDEGKLDNYWFRTGTPTYLIKLMEHFKENINEMTSRQYKPEEFIDYRADVEKPLPMIYQSGYLTIKGYDRHSNRYKLDFPNNEVKSGFLSMIATSYLRCRDNLSSWAYDAVTALRECDLDRLRDMLVSLLADVPCELLRKGDKKAEERYFHLAFYLIIKMIGVYTICSEKSSSNGRADCVIETPGYIYIIEFKLNGTAREAIAQIDERGYAQPYAADPRPLYRVGCSFSSATCTIGDWAVEPR